MYFHLTFSLTVKSSAHVPVPEYKKSRIREKTSLLIPPIMTQSLLCSDMSVRNMAWKYSLPDIRITCRKNKIKTEQKLND